jgi:L-asparaginase II
MNQISPRPPGTVCVRRGEWIESVHRVHVAVVDDRGRVLRSVGDVHLPTFYRSAAKPLQAVPLLDDGVVDRFHFTSSELAVCCASHNSEPRHVETVAGLLSKLKLDASALACGGHPPLRAEEGLRMAREGRRPGPLDSNCSGKHAGMLALAVAHGWSVDGYQDEGHPVQRRLKAEIARWADLDPAGLETGVDGCGVVCVRAPLDRIAASFARLALASREDGAARRVVRAMVDHPEMVAGIGRLDTAVMRATDGAVFAKVGAEGVYAAGIPGAGLGLALKIEDGAGRAADAAFVHILDELGQTDPTRDDAVARFRRPTLVNTRGEAVGRIDPEFELVRHG